MILSDLGIRDALAAKDIAIAPFDPERIQPASYDLVLGDTLKVPVVTNEPTFGDDIIWHDVPLKGKDFVLHRGCFCLGATLERVRLGADIGASLSGRSTIGRKGLAVHITAGWIDPGFDGHITLELYNCGPRPLILRAGTAIGQLIFHALDQTCRKPYAGRYQFAAGVEAPKLLLAGNELVVGGVWEG